MNIINKTIELHNQGLTVIQISKKINKSVTWVRSTINRKGYKVNRHEKIVLDNKLNQLLIGSLLGDGCIKKTDRPTHNNCFSLAHGHKQGAYCEYKYNIFKDYNLVNKLSCNISYNPRYKNPLREVRFRTKCHPIFNWLRKEWYPNEIKIVPKLVSDIDAFGLAIWFMDDGSICGKHGYIFHTDSFTIEECQFLIKVLKTNFDLNCNLQPANNRIYIPKDETDKFINIVEPYMLDSLRYKIRKGSCINRMNSVNTQKWAILSQASQQCVEGATTSVNDPSGNMKHHERPTFEYSNDDIV